MTETERRMSARRQLWTNAFAGIDLAGKAVLDAGTGQGFFARFLAEQRPARLVSVTCLEEEIPPARLELGEYASSVEFAVMDLTAMPQMPDASFDVVGADFLIAAVAAYSPYREIECLRELVRVLRPGGRLVLTGWEVWPELRNPLELAVRRLSKLRDAIHHLQGGEPFREHPRSWIESRLRDLEMPPERLCSLPDVHHDLSWLVKSVRKTLDGLEPPDLHQALAARIDALEGELATDRLPVGGFEFGRLYAVIACKLQGAILLG